ncbi:hypothetical protein [Chitinophaga nivalis]|uniref:Uncharacterized protein n=1 Tax=Chitinophaga nivalis TaxID=2991709 RepID=A0ABT3IIX4_9BACT|nr:hypothetical protein [Chitinophaga nivalis]MCW3466389.1 hypothetical protein [Chitinophaga nivalis]MCW3483920.1 hypothetical protein [Chitinophaga nivalis]
MYLQYWKTRLWVIIFFLLNNGVVAYSQSVNGIPLKSSGPLILAADAGVGHDYSYFKIVDGVIHIEMNVRTFEVAKEWKIFDKATITAIMPGSRADSVFVTNTINTKLERYVYEQVGHFIDTLPYKIPIILNEIFSESYKERRAALAFIKPADITTIRFLSKAEAHDKYGAAVLFGAIEITK